MGTPSAFAGRPGGGTTVSGPDRKIRYTRVLAVLFVIAGFAAARSTGAPSAGGPAGEADQSIPGRYVRMFGMAVCAAGFASIALGWNGAARLTVVDQQFPFLMSGGVLGVALVLFGVGVLLVSQIRTERQKLSRLLERLAGTLGRPSVDSMSVAAEC